MYFWSFMMASKPRKPAATITAAITTKAITLVSVPSLQRRRTKMVSTAKMASTMVTVSQPTNSR